MKTTFRLSILFMLTVALAVAQSTTPSTTLSAVLTGVSSANYVCLASTTNVLYGNGNYGGLYVDQEYMQITSAPSGNCVTVVRGEQGTAVNAHASGQTVWVDQYLSTGMDSGFRQGASQVPYGVCTRTSQATLPLIYVASANVLDCPSSTGRWTAYTYERTLMIGPGSCAWSTSGTYAAQVAVATGGPNIQGLTSIGSSYIPVNQISLAAAANNNLLTCLLTSDVFQPLLNKGVTITSYDVIYGVQTTTLTSINGASVGTIAFPAPGQSESASTVAPVAAGGSLTTSSTTGNMAATTAGAFRNIRTTLGTPLNLSTDITAVVFTLSFNQSAASAEVLQTPGMLIHYNFQEK